MNVPVCSAWLPTAAGPAAERHDERELVPRGHSRRVVVDGRHGPRVLGHPRARDRVVEDRQAPGGNEVAVQQRVEVRLLEAVDPIPGEEVSPPRDRPRLREQPPGRAAGADRAVRAGVDDERDARPSRATVDDRILVEGVDHRVDRGLTQLLAAGGVGHPVKVHEDVGTVERHTHRGQIDELRWVPAAGIDRDTILLPVERDPVAGRVALELRRPVLDHPGRLERIPRGRRLVEVVGPDEGVVVVHGHLRAAATDPIGDGELRPGRHAA